MNDTASLIPQSNPEMSQVITALVAGKKVTLFSSEVVAEGIEYEWQTPLIRIRHKNGSSIPANWNDYSAMTIHS